MNHDGIYNKVWVHLAVVSLGALMQLFPWRPLGDHRWVHYRICDSNLLSDKTRFLPVRRHKSCLVLPTSNLFGDFDN
jgi:hypothetical protein